MRTTVSLDDDVAAEVKRRMVAEDASFKQVLNEALRRGLRPSGPPAPRYELPTYDLGLRPGIDFTKALQLAGELEDEAVLAKLDLRK